MGVKMRKFWLHREEDVSGISGTGVVAEGVQFSDGSCVIRWLGDLTSTNSYHNMAALEAIHGHDGKTKIVWED